MEKLDEGIEVYLGASRKLQALQEVCRAKKVSFEEVCYIGDDLPDLEIIQTVGFSCAPADAVAVVRKSVNRFERSRWKRSYKRIFRFVRLHTRIDIHF